MEANELSSAGARRMNGLNRDGNGVCAATLEQSDDKT